MIFDTLRNLIPTTRAADPSATPFPISEIHFADPKGGANYTGLENIVGTVINVFLDVAGVLAIIYVIYSGILYLTSAGNPDNIKKAQTGLIYGGIGIAIIILSRFLVETVVQWVLRVTGS